jgi:hypothetical protein
MRNKRERGMRKVILVLIVLLPMLANISVLTSVTSAATITEYYMFGKDIDYPNGYEGHSLEFKTTDNAACIVVKFDPNDCVKKGNTCSLRWYYPNGSLYKVETSKAFGDLLFSSHCILIFGNSPAYNPGRWHIDCYVNNVKQFTEFFTILGPTPKPTPKPAGFEVVIAISGLLTVAYLMKRWK